MICSATWSVTFCATGIGWYGDPAQQGGLTPLTHSRDLAASRL